MNEEELKEWLKNTSTGNQTSRPLSKYLQTNKEIGHVRQLLKGDNEQKEDRR